MTRRSQENRDLVARARERASRVLPQAEAFSHELARLRSVVKDPPADRWSQAVRDRRRMAKAAVRKAIPAPPSSSPTIHRDATEVIGPSHRAYKSIHDFVGDRATFGNLPDDSSFADDPRPSAQPQPNDELTTFPMDVDTALDGDFPALEGDVDCYIEQEQAVHHLVSIPEDIQTSHGPRATERQAPHADESASEIEDNGSFTLARTASASGAVRTVTKPGCGKKRKVPSLPYRVWLPSSVDNKARWQVIEVLPLDTQNELKSIFQSELRPKARAKTFAMWNDPNNSRAHYNRCILHGLMAKLAPLYPEHQACEYCVSRRLLCAVFHELPGEQRAFIGLLPLHASLRVGRSEGDIGYWRVPNC
ncbi:hypothetical protein ACN47E_004639 [Coniothyrium glycines]